MPDCLHETFNCTNRAVFVCDDCGEEWGLLDPRWDTWQEHIDDASKPSTLF